MIAIAASLAAFGSGSVAARTTAPASGQHSQSPTYTLPGPAIVGQTAQSSVSYDSTINSTPASGALSVHAVVARTVTAVDAAGGYQTQAVVTSIEVSRAPSGFNTGQIDGLAGLTVQQSFTATGAPIDAGTSAAVGSGPPASGTGHLLDWIAATSIAFPAEPVAVGASWPSAGQASVGGVTVPIEYQCRLASVDDSQYVVELSYAADFDATATSMGDVSGTIAGWGTMTGSRSNPLVVSGSVNQSIDGWARVGETTAPLSVTSTLTVTSA